MILQLKSSAASILGSKVVQNSLIALAVGIAARKTYSLVTGWYIKRLLRRKAQEKRDQAAEQRRKLKARLQGKNGQLVTSRRQEIVSLGIHQLVEKLQNRELTCLEVLHAYQAKALEATEQLNCITEFITEAEAGTAETTDFHPNSAGRRLAVGRSAGARPAGFGIAISSGLVDKSKLSYQKWAMELDSSPVKGPLHGVPFSVKDNFHVAGYNKSLGIAKALGYLSPHDAPIVTALKTLGALPFCRTNVPQLTVSYASSNPVWGETVNPFALDRTPGGSSSGDASLVGAGASLFGLGTDVGGSLRVPASFCGAATLKATPLRILHDAPDGVVGLTGMPGFIARDVETLAFVSKVLWSSGYHAKYDPRLAPIPWQDQNRKKLRIGYYEECTGFPVTPGVRRALQLTRKLLTQDGHEVVPFNPPGLDKGSLKVLMLMHADCFKTSEMAVKYEDIDSSLSTQHWYGRSIPWMLRPLAASVVRLHSPVLADYLETVGGRTTPYSYQLWKEIQCKFLCTQELIRQWKAEELDLCIGPVFISPAPRLKDIDHFTVLGCYTAYYNYVDFPAGSVPVTTENKKDQELLNAYPTNDTLLKLVRKTTQGAVGLPIGVQVIALPFQEEAVLHGMKLIENLLGNKGNIMSA